VEKHFHKPEQNDAFMHSILQVSQFIAAWVRRAWAKIERLVGSNTGLARRASEKCQALKRRAKETERIDRLRNPSDYQGR
jgi:hypothetical protein